MKAALLAFSAGVALAAGLAAQCPIQTLTTAHVGAGCNAGPTGCCALPSAPAFVSAELDLSRCELQIHLHALVGCCGVDAPVRLLAIGFSQISVPVPQLGPSCVLHVAPAVWLASSGELFALRLPAGLPPQTVFTQGVVLHTQPLPPTTTVTMSNAMSLGLR